MDFSALNPETTNSVSFAARNNDVKTLEKLFKTKKFNANGIDNRGWTALHEAAANNCPEALEMILGHPETRPLVETFEGQTALYLACRNKCSMTIINMLLEKVKDIVEYASTEMVSPLHVVCGQGRLEVAEVLISAGALLNLQDFDGDTPLHEAARGGYPQLVSALLHAGAEPELRNLNGLTPFLFACFKGSLDCVKELMPFISNINQAACDGTTGLISATQRGSLEVVRYLLANDADPDRTNKDGVLPLYMALSEGHAKLFELLLPVTTPSKITINLMSYACKPLYFSMDIIITLLQSNLAPEYFNKCDRFYVIMETIFGVKLTYSVNPPLCSYLHVAEYIYKTAKGLCGTLLLLLLTKGVAVNALYRRECPPLVYLHFCEHVNCFSQVIDILISHDCNVDYSTIPEDKELKVPDAIIASVTSSGHTLPLLLSYSLRVDPDYVVEKLLDYNMIGRRISPEIIMKILPMCGFSKKTLDRLNAQLEVYLLKEQTDGCSNLSDMLVYRVPSLKHKCRAAIRSRLRRNIFTTKDFLRSLNRLPLPSMLKLYLRFAHFS